MMRLPTIVFILAAATTKASAQAPADTVAALDTIVQHLTRIGRASGESIWPGFRPDTIPYSFVFPGRGTALFNWRGSFPEGFGPIPGTTHAAWQNQGALGAASTGTTIGGRPVAQVVVSAIDASALLPTAIHEAFHVFEAVSARKGRRFGRGENSFYVSSYPIFDVRNELLFAREGELLAEALREPAVTRKRALARQFVAVRRERHRLLDDTYAEFDKASEMNEGLAEYALVRAVALLARDRTVPDSWRRHAQQRLSEQNARLARLTGNVSQSFRLRYYSTGPAQGRLLDDLAGPGWKRELIDRNETLQDALARATGLSDSGDRALRLAMRPADTSRIGAATRTAIGNLVALRARQVDSVLAVPGVLVELSASALPARDFGFCGFDPQNHLQVSTTTQLQTRWWKPCSGKALNAEFNVPSVHDTKAGTIRAVIGSESDVKISIAGKPVTLADGQRIDGASDVRIEAPRASIQSVRANLERIGRAIRLTPIPDP
ncbi:MAG TPA: hypothetical protein VM166_05745 [Gemmatimonadaceae bacterium]|nr:hypothetical protein [Gemmatimonadaceae bacterium]